MAGLSSLAAFGVGQLMGSGAILGSQFAGDVLRGAAGSALSQGVGDLVGIHKFDFAGVAAAGIGAGLSGAVTRTFSKGEFADGSTSYTVAGNEGPVVLGRGSWAQTGDIGWGTQALSRTAGLVANAATRAAWNNENLGRSIIAAIPDVVAQTLQAAMYGGSKATHSRAMSEVPTVKTVSAPLHPLGAMTPIQILDEGMRQPEGPTRTITGEVSPEKARQYSREWFALREDPLYRDVAEHNANYWDAYARQSSRPAPTSATVEPVGEIAPVDVRVSTPDFVARWDAAQEYRNNWLSDKSNLAVSMRLDKEAADLRAR